MHDISSFRRYAALVTTPLPLYQLVVLHCSMHLAWASFLTTPSIPPRRDPLSRYPHDWIICVTMQYILLYQKPTIASIDKLDTVSASTTTIPEMEKVKSLHVTKRMLSIHPYCSLHCITPLHALLVLSWCRSDEAKKSIAHTERIYESLNVTKTTPCVSLKGLAFDFISSRFIEV